MLIVILAAIRWYLGRGKQSIKDHDLEFYSQATWEDLVLVPALDTVFSLGWCAPFGCKQECIIEKEPDPLLLGGVWGQD